MMYKKLLQRQSSDETESSCCSRSSAAHRRTPSFIGVIQFDSSEEEVEVWRRDPPTKDVSFLSVHKEDNCSPECKIHLKKCLGGDDETLRALELIRELSFDFGSGPKRRASIDTSSTDSTSSSSECDASFVKPQHIHPCVSYSRMDSSSSLIGLKYLPDDW
jgi:hypothetical protein